MADYSIELSPLTAAAERLATEGKTPMYIAVNGELAGLIAVADPIKSTSRAAIASIAPFRRGEERTAPGDLSGEIEAALATGMTGFFTDQPDVGRAVCDSRARPPGG